MMNIAVFISGSGTNLQALIDWEKQGKLLASIKLVVSNKTDAYGLIRAQEAGIKTAVVNNKDFKTREEHEEVIQSFLKENNIELIVLAGYMRLLTPTFVKSWSHKIINLHPSLLPSFTGINAIEQAFTYGVKVTGVSTIFVDDGVDTGLIILQETVDVSSNYTLDSLTTKIHDLEHKLLPKTVNIVASNKYTITGRKVLINSE